MSAADLDPDCGLFIGGRWRAAGGGSFPVQDPATGAEIGRAADGTADDAVAAVSAAAEAQRSWASTPARQRADTLMSAWELMRRDSGPLARLVSLENGKSAADAHAEIVYAADFLRCWPMSRPTTRSLPRNSSVPSHRWCRGPMTTS